MKKLLLIIPLIFVTLALSAQEGTFLYKRSSGLIQLISESDTISLFDYRRSPNGTRERKVEMDGKTFTLSISKRKKDRTQTITDETAMRYARVSLGTRNRYDITLEDGTVLECSVTGRNWTYTVDGKEVVKVTCKKEYGQRKILIQSIDLQNLSPVVMLSSLERATDRYVSAARTTPMIISAVALAVIRTAMMNNSEPAY